jgi:hypothetical protein
MTLTIMVLSIMILWRMILSRMLLNTITLVDRMTIKRGSFNIMSSQTICKCRADSRVDTRHSFHSVIMKNFCRLNVIASVLVGVLAIVELFCPSLIFAAEPM